jgi:hypothetical protein
MIGLDVPPLRPLSSGRDVLAVVLMTDCDEDISP